MIHCVINLYAAMDFLKPQLTSMTHVQLNYDLFMELMESSCYDVQSQFAEND